MCSNSGLPMQYASYYPSTIPTHTISDRSYLVGREKVLRLSIITRSVASYRPTVSIPHKGKYRACLVEVYIPTFVLSE